MELLLFVLFLLILGMLNKHLSLIYSMFFSIVFGLLALVTIPIDLIYKSFKKVEK